MLLKFRVFSGFFPIVQSLAYLNWVLNRTQFEKKFLGKLLNVIVAVSHDVKILVLR